MKKCILIWFGICSLASAQEQLKDVMQLQENVFKIKEDGTRKFLSYCSFTENYNSSGEPTERKYNNKEGNTVAKEVYEYLPNGQKFRKATYNKSGNNIKNIFYKYDSQGKLIEAIEYDLSYLTKYTFVYDENGHLISELQYNKKGKLMKRFEYKNNPDGSINSVQSYDSNGNLKATRYYEYTDLTTQGHWTKCYIKNSKGSVLSLTERDIKYYK